MSLVFQILTPCTSLSARRVCPHPPPPPTKAGGTYSPGGEGGEGSIFWKTREIGLPSYSNNLSTVFPISLYLYPSPCHSLYVQIRSGLITATLVALIMSGVGVLWAYMDTTTNNNNALPSAVSNSSSLSTTTEFATALFNSSANSNSSLGGVAGGLTADNFIMFSSPPTTTDDDDDDVSSTPLPLLPPSMSPHPLWFGAVIFVGAWISMMVSTVNGASTPILVSARTSSA
jgi:hypothetical protein